MNPSHPGILIPPEYKYVIVSLLPIPWLLLGQTIMVGRYRRKAGISYPQVYADKAEAKASKDAHLFNCVQRAHQNTLEVVPIYVITTIVSGINYPKSAAAMCTIWIASRIPYTIGYASGDPGKRSGMLFHLSTATLLGLLAVTTYHVAAHWLLA